jgi:antitoxin MazE
MGVKARIVKIGNSRGIRIPRALLDQAELGDEVELAVVDKRLVISAARKPRDGWDGRFREMAGYGDDRLLDADAPPSAWDSEEWEW